LLSMLRALRLLLENDTVHQAAASDVDFRKRAARGSGVSSAAIPDARESEIDYPFFIFLGLALIFSRVSFTLNFTIFLIKLNGTGLSSGN